jgi:hypothetical protein
MRSDSREKDRPPGEAAPLITRDHSAIQLHDDTHILTRKSSIGLDLVKWKFDKAHIGFPSEARPTTSEEATRQIRGKRHLDRVHSISTPMSDHLLPIRTD